MSEMKHQSVSLRAYAALVRSNRNFRRLWMAQIVSEIGDWFYMVALYAMLLEFTGSAKVLGVAFTLQVLPTAMMGPIAGIINDRLRRKHVMIATDLGRAVAVTCMLLVRTPHMVWLVYPLLFIETVLWGLFEPARTSVIPNVAGEENVMVANTLASTTWSLNLFLGAAIGGAAAAIFGRNTIFVLNGASFLVSAFLISGMRFSEPHTEGRAQFHWRDLFGVSDLVEGVRYVRTRPRMTSALLVKAGLGITGASWVIFPVMGKVVFPITGRGISPERAALLGMSALMGARGLGALIGPLTFAQWAQQRAERLRVAIFTGFLLYGSGYVVLGYIQHAPIAYASVVISHIGGSVIWVFSTTLLQLMTDDKFRGRVFAAELSFCTIMLAISAYLAGAAIDRGINVRTVALATGIITVLTGIIWGAAGLPRRASLDVVPAQSGASE
jgi:MFS family permease